MTAGLTLLNPLLLILVLAMMGGYFWYVSIVRRRNQVQEALATIDAQLRQRFDLIPNILRIASKYMEHEQALMASIAALRTQAIARYNPADAQSLQGHFSTVEQLSSQMGNLMVNSEQYPELKSDAAVRDAMHAYIESEAQITAARRFYNSAVKDYNNAVEIFPGNLIAAAIAAKKMPIFEVTQTARLPIQFMPNGTMENVAIASDPAARIEHAAAPSESPHAKLR